MKIKKGDNVKVLAGKDKGKTGKVIQVLPAENRVVVDGVNKSYKHVRAHKSGEKGQKIDFFGPIHASNVALLSKDNTPTRIGYKVLEDGKKVRIDRKSGETIE